MNYVERLNQALRQQLRLSWTDDKSGGERVWFLVFDPDRLRSVIAGKDLFRLTVEGTGKRWVEIDVSRDFGAWMRSHRYAARYFARPERATTLVNDFARHLAAHITNEIGTAGADDQTLVVLTGTEALFGITRISYITRLIEGSIPGRLLVFFPGEYREPQYRFLDARDGWNYLAIPIVPVGGRGDS
jgi:hypothetical protein